MDVLSSRPVRAKPAIIASHRYPPEELILDIDASDVPLHGNRETSEFHAPHDHHRYLPLYVFYSQAMLACVLRRSLIDGAKNAAAVAKLLVQRLRLTWPETRIIVRGDSGFSRQRLLRWCERSGVHYIVGLTCNARLEASVHAADSLSAGLGARRATATAHGTREPRMFVDFATHFRSNRVNVQENGSDQSAASIRFGLDLPTEQCLNFQTNNLDLIPKGFDPKGKPEACGLKKSG
jgi:hypothetical protein